MNERIEQLLQGLTVGSNELPVVQGYYFGHGEDYVVYDFAGPGDPFYGDDGILCWLEYYDVDIYTKGNLQPIEAEIRARLKAGDFEWQPSRSSGDLYEQETGYHHRTLCFAIIKEDR